MILASIAAFFGGLLAHQSKRITSRIKGGFQPLTEHGIGVMAVSPFFVWIFALIAPKVPAKIESHEQAIAMEHKMMGATIAAFFSSFLLFGVGVAFGWLLDTLQSKSR